MRVREGLMEDGRRRERERMKRMVRGRKEMYRME